MALAVVVTAVVAAVAAAAVAVDTGDVEEQVVGEIRCSIALAAAVQATGADCSLGTPLFKTAAEMYGLSVLIPGERTSGGAGEAEPEGEVDRAWIVICKEAIVEIVIS